MVHWRSWISRSWFLHTSSSGHSWIFVTGPQHHFYGLVKSHLPRCLTSSELAENEDLYVVMLPLWCDDVSGNKSKQYNKHINIYMANSSIPGRLLQQEYFVHFVSMSPTASSPEQFSALKAQVEEMHKKPIQCFNSATQHNCWVILRVPYLPADNPQQSEEASHIGENGNCLCCKCKAGGSYKLTV